MGRIGYKKQEEKILRKVRKITEFHNKKMTNKNCNKNVINPKSTARKTRLRQYKTQK